LTLNAIFYESNDLNKVTLFLLKSYAKRLVNLVSCNKIK
jgi:hypothetical protein